MLFMTGSLRKRRAHTAPRTAPRSAPRSAPRTTPIAAYVASHWNWTGLLQGMPAVLYEFASAAPFPHLVRDGFLPEDLLARLNLAFPDPPPDLDSVSACRRPARISALHRGFYCATRRRQGNGGYLKVGLMEEKQMSHVVADVLGAMKAPSFVAFLRQLSGLHNLASDPYNHGGGLHQILPNGSLQVHADFNSHPITDDERRVNVFLYLNDEWRDEWGGDLELWNRGMTQCTTRIRAIANRLVIFTSTDFSYHGHPDRLLCPPGRSRRSLALYFYTPRHDHRPAGEVNQAARRTEKSTLYQQRLCASCALPMCRPVQNVSVS